MTERALVQNAGSGSQTRRAGKKERQAARRVAAFVAAVMALPEGRECMWWLLDHCRTFASVMRDGGERVEYNAGKQDVGHMLQDTIISTDPDSYLLMQREAIDRKRVDQITAPEETPGMVSEPTATEDDDA